MDHSLISLMTFFITVSQNKKFFSASSIIKILGIFLIVVLVENSYTDHLRIVTYCLKDIIPLTIKKLTNIIEDWIKEEDETAPVLGLLVVVVVGGGGLGFSLQQTLGSVSFTFPLIF